jgi:hypothetical protein
MQPEDVFITIGKPLAHLIGRDGYRALLERSLNLAAENHSVLRTVRPAIAPAGRLVGLQRTRPGEVLDAMGATLTILLTMLVDFLGTDLAWQVLRPSACDHAAASEGAAGALSASDCGIQ